MRHVVRKVATMEGGLVWFGSGFHHGDVVSGQVDLYMTSIELVLWLYSCKQIIEL